MDSWAFAHYESILSTSQNGSAYETSLLSLEKVNYSNAFSTRRKLFPYKQELKYYDSGGYQEQF